MKYLEFLTYVKNVWGVALPTFPPPTWSLLLGYFKRSWTRLTIISDSLYTLTVECVLEVYFIIGRGGVYLFFTSNDSLVISEAISSLFLQVFPIAFIILEFLIGTEHRAAPFVFCNVFHNIFGIFGIILSLFKFEPECCRVC
jgi:hypothetical protein